MKPLLVFDYDGTINETLRIYEPAVRDTENWLKTEHNLEPKNLTTQRIASWLGKNSIEMWSEFMPGIDASISTEGGHRIGEIMFSMLESGKGKWYEGIVDALDYLINAGYTMVILSNCRKKYAMVNNEVFGMSRWFSEWFDCESFNNAPKTEIIKVINDKYQRDIIVIGDRAGDIAAAKPVNAKSIGCLYGYGSREELKAADILIDSPDELVNAIESIERRENNEG